MIELLVELADADEMDVAVDPALLAIGADVLRPGVPQEEVVGFGFRRFEVDEVGKRGKLAISGG